MATKGPTPDILGGRLYTESSVSASLSTGSTTFASSMATGVLYILAADVDWHWHQGGSGVTASSSTDFIMAAFAEREVWCDGTDSSQIAGALESGTGKMYRKAVR